MDQSSLAWKRNNWGHRTEICVAGEVRERLVDVGKHKEVTQCTAALLP